MTGLVEWKRGNAMQPFFEIKGIPFGGGKPVVCVPVIDRKKEDVIGHIRRLAEKQAQMIEWRVDAYAGADDPGSVREVLEAVKPCLGGTVFLFTFRTAKQGGCREMVEKNIINLNETAAKSGCADIIDMEFFEATRPEKNIRRLQRMGCRVIASHHDFERTPDSTILSVLMDQMIEGGADIAKIAVMPQSSEDVVRLLKLTVDTRGKYPEQPVATMAMGPLGAVSRVSGETFGSCITFGSDGKASAPGQLPADRLQMVLDILHESMCGQE